MDNFTKEDVVNALGNLSVMELIALTRQLEAQWGVKAEPPVVQVERQEVKDEKATQTEFTVILASVPADKKMAVIKVVRELTGLGLKESKELVESAPKPVKELIMASEADELKTKLTAAGAVVEVK